MVDLEMGIDNSYCKNFLIQCDDTKQHRIQNIKNQIQRYSELGRYKGGKLTQEIGVAVLVDSSAAILASVLIKPTMQRCFGLGVISDIFAASVGAISGKLCATVIEPFVGHVVFLKKGGEFVGCVIGGGIGLCVGVKCIKPRI